jgi:UDP-N-acetylmuramyl pentapeptide phosphotransferase/UDP-N-acetylglucosamine-1-phosphate transferase
VILELAGAVAISALVSLVACRFLMTAGPVDRPNAPRKAHGAPTPTSGGVGIAIGFAVGLMLLALFSDTLRRELTPRGAAMLSVSASFTYLFLIIGFWDDARPLGARVKFALFAAVSLGAALSVGIVRELPIGAGVVWVAPFWFGLIGTALWIFTLVNSVNFMDGANGLAMGSAAIGLAALAAISSAHGSIAGVVIALCAAGALTGFLFWNFPAGRLFAGDSGALFAGALAALASLIVIHRAGVSPLIPPIVFFPLLADVLVTLAWRAYRRHSLFDGHSEHLYQIARHGGMSHAEVALIYWAATAACGAIAFLVAADDGLAPAVALAALAAASIVISVVVRRFAARAGVSGV